MKWDVKIALYLFLGYAFYGISYLFSHGDYVVPLPMLFIFIPIVAIIFIFSHRFNSYTFFFLLLPLSVMSDKINEFSPTLSDIGAFISILSCVALGIFLLIDKRYRRQQQANVLLIAYPIVCISALLFLLNNTFINMLLFLALGVTSALIVRDDEEKFKLFIPIRRVLILSSFVSWMYLVTLLSVYLA